MIFSSFEFLVFFAAVLALRAGLRDLEREKRFLLLASWLFYMSWGPRFVVLIVFTSLVDWWIGRRLGETDDARSRRRLLVTSLVLNLGVLATPAGFSAAANSATTAVTHQPTRDD